nr:chaperone protein DnaJ C76, chloroplastic [Ipomoea batatas]
MLGTNSSSVSSHGGRRKGGFGRIRVAYQESAASEEVADDYYAVLGLLPDASPEQIKKAYYNCMKACHPDLSGEDEETTNFCMFINEIYEVLSDPVQRLVYDEIHGYAATAINPFFDDSSPKDHVFVDEFSCIDFGRARVYSQSGSQELIQQAIESCPVDCIHWTSAAQLSLLEDEMRRVERVNVALMLSGMGAASIDVFRMGQAKVRMTKKKGSDKTDSYWDNLWGKPRDYQSTEEEAKERAGRAAAAARRWREYSRKGVDKRPTFKLPEAASKDN